MQVERTRTRLHQRRESGKREHNALVTYLEVANNSPKGGLIRDIVPTVNVVMKAPALREGPMFYQLVGEVMAHQGDDG
jgi:hypothetical protein